MQPKQRRYRNYTLEQMQNAIQDIRINGLKVLTAAKKHNVPCNTLRDRITGRVQDEHPLLSLVHEARLAEHIQHLGLLGYWYSVNDIRQIANIYVKSLGINLAATLSQSWSRYFIKRHAEVESVSLIRGLTKKEICMSPNYIDAYYDEARCVYENHQLFDHPDNVFYVEETRVVAPFEKKVSLGIENLY